MIFKAIISNHKYISNIFDAISGILDSGNLIISNNNIKISGMDASHVSLIELKLDKNDFDYYEINTERPINIGLDYSDFVKILKMGDMNDTLIFEYENSEELYIYFKDDEISRKFSIRLIDVDQNELKPPKIEFNMELQISTKLFSKILNSFIVTESEHITFNINDNLLSINSSGLSSKLDMSFNKSESKIKSKKLKINSKNQKNIEETEETRFKLKKCEGNFSASFGMNLLKKFSKINTFVEKLQCNLSPDMPIRFDYPLNNKSYIKLYLSPKYEAD